MPLLTLTDLLIEQTRDLYNAESQYKAILPSMVTSSTDEELHKELEIISEQVVANVSWLEHAATYLEISPDGVTCEAMRGLVRETRDTLVKYGDPHVIDAALIANAQRIAHYQIAGYGTARQFAKVLGLDRVADVFADLARAAGNMDQRLTKVANGGWFARGVNQRAEKKPSAAAVPSPALDVAAQH